MKKWLVEAGTMALAVPLWLIAMPTTLLGLFTGYLFGTFQAAHQHGRDASIMGQREREKTLAMIAEVKRMFPDAKTNMDPPGRVQ